MANEDKKDFNVMLHDSKDIFCFANRLRQSSQTLEIQRR